jgi:DNA mismatch endonuclease (patch repair protein)
MQANRRRDTKPEIALRRLLHARGRRFRVDYPPISGLRRRADLVFTRYKVAVYIDGCFWHACPLHGTVAKANAGFWAEKLAANQRRDRDTDQRLTEAGWGVVRVWEHEAPPEAADRVEEALAERSMSASCHVADQRVSSARTGRRPRLADKEGDPG